MTEVSVAIDCQTGIIQHQSWRWQRRDGSKQKVKRASAHTSRMSFILSWVLTLRIRLVDAPLLALRSCCGAGMEEDPEAEAEAEAAAVTVLALLTVGRLGPGTAEGEWEKEEEDGLPPGRGAAMAARRESRISDISRCQGGGRS